MAGDEKRVKVKIDHVEKIYDGRKGRMVALNGVDLDIMENEFICVVGPSGCGKSTLLNIIAGLLEPTSGAVYVDGKKVEGTGIERGVVFQQYALFPWLTVLKNVMFGLKLKGMKDDEAREVAMKYIKMVQLEDFVDAYPKELSGGMKQRVAIARAYAVQPEVLLMDEATSALDPISTSKIEDLALELKNKYTIVMVTHNMQQAARISDKTAFFLLGEIIEFNDTETLFSMPRDKRTEDYITGRFG